jgi:MFS family permease
LRHPGLLAFTSSAAILILELVAERIIAPHVGVSLYTWTGIIGVILAAMSIGYFVGGWVADRWGSRRLLGLIFVAGGIASLGALVGAEWQGFSNSSLSLVPRVLVVVAALFFAPAAILGMVSPMVVRLALRDLSRTGRTAGSVYAWGTAGSIAGTLATGFVLVPLLDTHVIVAGVTAVVVSVGLVLALRGGATLPVVADTAQEQDGPRDEGVR